MTSCILFVFNFKNKKKEAAEGMSTMKCCIVFLLLHFPQCPSKTFGGFDTTKDLPDDVITFARLHPAMYNPVQPVGGRPIVVRTDAEYQFTQLVVDRVEAEDGQYDVMFIGTG